MRSFFWPSSKVLPVSSSSGRKRRLNADVLLVANDLLVIWDFVSVIACGYATALLIKIAGSPHVISSEFVNDAQKVVLLGALLAPFTLTNRNAFTFECLGKLVPLATATATRVAVLLALILAFIILTRLPGALPRTWIIAWSLTIAGCAIGSRVALGRYLSRLEQQGVLRERVAIVGEEDATSQLLDHLRRTSARGLDVVFVHNLLTNPLSSLLRLAHEERLDAVIVVVPEHRTLLIADLTRELKALDVEILLCPRQLEPDLFVRRSRDIAGTVMWQLAHRPIQRWGLVVKAVGDKVFGAVLLLILSPLMLAVAIAVRIDSPGPIFFRQRRHGWNNTEFDVWKFRTMAWTAEIPALGVQQTRRGDRRVTRVGRILRKTSLDELPQLFNVLRGEMSLVGPRPHPVVMRTQEKLAGEIVAEYAHRHRVKPGITGWAQVNGLRGATETAEQIRKRVEHDLFYIENWSILLDFKILALTPLSVLFDTDRAF